MEERRALLQRVLCSRQIEKSTRIREFLVYVCERTFEDPGAETHEQEIGHRVFGRPAEYDTALDNVVRVTASQARKKLEQYFASDGAWEPLVLEIPKGQYAPTFRERAIEPVVEIPVKTAEPRRTAVWPLAVVCLLLVGLLGWALFALRSERLAARSPIEASPALGALWSQILPPAGRTDIVVSDSSLSLFQELLDRQLSLSEYLNLSQWTDASGLSGNPQLRDFAQRAAQRHFTSIGSVTAAYRIAQLAGRNQNHVSIFSARDFNIRQMKFDNVVLLGSTRANPWLELIDERLNFHFGYDQQARHGYFENRHPLAGETPFYRTDAHTSYCQLAFVPNLDKTGNILAIAGTEVEGTEGGGEFVTSADSLTLLRDLLHAGTDGRLPYFEVLLKSDRVGGLAPRFSVTAVRRVRP